MENSTNMYENGKAAFHSAARGDSSTRFTVLILLGYTARTTQGYYLEIRILHKYSSTFAANESDDEPNVNGSELTLRKLNELLTPLQLLTVEAL